MNTNKKIFSHAADLIDKGWCKASLATDKDKQQVDVHSDEACRFCMLGAIDRSMFDVVGFDYYKDNENCWKIYKTIRDKLFSKTYAQTTSMSIYNDIYAKMPNDVSDIFRELARDCK